MLDLAALRFTTDFLVYLSLAAIWNLLAGYGGMISVGQQAYIGIGGYAFFASLVFFGLPLPASILIAMASSAAAALVFAPLLLRLKGPHFAIGDMGHGRTVPARGRQYAIPWRRFRNEPSGERRQTDRGRPGRSRSGDLLLRASAGLLVDCRLGSHLSRSEKM
ncbi:hypothetical protein NKI56_36070 [Mesorhizobium sp. M0622]